MAVRDAVMLAPPEVVAALSNAFKKALESEEVKTKMVSQGADPAFLDSAGFTGFLKTELGRWGAAVKKAGVTLN